MKYFLLIFIFYSIVSCTSSNQVYWCGDHPCISNKEKEAYFKKTMIVEIRELRLKDLKKSSEIESIIKQATIDEKKRIKKEVSLEKQAKQEIKRKLQEEKELVKEAKLEEKRRLKEEKELAKQVKLEEKRRLKEEKELAKQVKLEEKRRLKEEKELVKQPKIIKNKSKKKKKIAKRLEKKVVLNNSLINYGDETNRFTELVEKITKGNSLKPFPNINDIPN